MIPVARQLADWVSGIRLRDLPSEVVRAALDCIVDTTGVGLAGTSHPTARAVLRSLPRDYAAGCARVWGEEAACAASGAALANGTAAHALDFDDTSYAGIVHGSAAVWPAVLACAETLDVPGECALEAFIAGVEIEYALGRALPERVYFDGWWTSGVLGAIGAAAGAAKALGLDREKTRHAVSFAACQATGMRAMIGTAAKPLALGRAAQTGVQAAWFAHDGHDAPADAFEHENGFVQLIAAGTFDAAALRVGTRFALIDPGVAFKLFPACSATQAAAETVADLMIENQLAPEDVVAVHCEVTPLVAVSLRYDDPRTVTEAQFSMPYAVGCILTFGDFAAHHLDDSLLRDPRLRSAMRKVTMTRNDALLATESDRRDHPEGAIVHVMLRDGRRLTRNNGAATGMPIKPMPAARLHEKFMSCTAALLTEAAADALLRRLHGLAQLPSCRDLFAELWPRR